MSEPQTKTRGAETVSTTIAIAPETAEPPKPEPIHDDTRKLENIFKLEEELAKASLAHYRDSEKAKSSKKRVETAQEALNGYILYLREVLPLFDKQSEPEKPGPDAWRSVSLRTIDGLTPSVLDQLEEIEIRTLGEFSDWGATGKTWGNLKGVGPHRAETLNAALEAFWATHPELMAAADDEIVKHIEDNDHA